MKASKKFLTSLITCFMLVTVFSAYPVTVVAADGIIEYIQVNTEVPATGQVVKSIDITVNDETVLEDLTAEDFTVTGEAIGYQTDPFDFDAVATDIKINGSVATLLLKDFPAYYYTLDFSVSCTNPDLNFTMENVDFVDAGAANGFDLYRRGIEASFNYALYSPKDTSQAQPLVLALHGGGERGDGDFIGLYANTVVISWAEESHQEKHPSYVLAPQFGPSTDPALTDDQVIDATLALIEEMIADGKVDPNRIYVTGCSFGGGNTFKFLVKNPDMFAAAIPICPSIRSLVEPESGGTYTVGEIAEIVKDVPMWLAHAETDPQVTVDYSRDMYKALLDLGSETVKYTEYISDQMNARGLSNHHHSWVLVNEDSAYYEWMFAQTKEVEEDPESSEESSEEESSIATTSASNPKTGAQDTVPMIMLSLFGVSAFVIIKKRVKTFEVE